MQLVNSIYATCIGAVFAPERFKTRCFRVIIATLYSFKRIFGKLCHNKIDKASDISNKMAHAFCVQSSCTFCRYKKKKNVFLGEQAYSHRENAMRYARFSYRRLNLKACRARIYNYSHEITLHRLRCNPVCCKSAGYIFLG